jgi:predicted restriction endonuclease
MPPTYTEAHHVQPWQDGGPTEPQNLVLLCGWHHHRVHDQHWTLRYHHRTNTVTAYRPDGSQLSLPGD